MKIQLESDLQPDDVQWIRDGLESYNREKVDFHPYQPLNIFIRNEENQIIGGLLDGTFWNWCHIDILWLDESIRHGGCGSQLLRMAE
jgi:hypothetical protein